MKQDVLNALLAHAKYTFSEIDWNFELLTRKEKSLIKNQDTLNKIKWLAEAKPSTKQSTNIDINLDWNPNDPRNW